ncbi:MAG: histidine phosphatase family protein [Proteobacteria bacterium]|nr:MAG: histidine phosphatase family protein [Pseudomonadota bacterium]
MEAITEFIVVRHGETAWNAEARIQGHLDSPLNEEGLAQALLVGDRLAQAPFSQLYCSDLGRALQTAQPIADRSHRRITREERLRERHLGVFQGLTGTECEHAYPSDYACFKSRDPDHVIPGGESIRMLQARARGIFTELAARHAGERLVVVTHGGVLDALYRFVTDTPLEKLRDFPIYNASINIVHHDGARWSLERWGDISHLTRDAALDDF